MKKTLAMIAAAAVLSACGGSDDDGGTAGDPGEPNETVAQATPMTPGTPVLGTISTLSDVDVYSFTVPVGGATVNIQTFDQGGVNCDPTNDSVDPYVVVYDGNGDYVTASDDSGINWCEDFNVALAAGTNYVEVSGYPPVPFVYTLKVNIP